MATHTFLAVYIWSWLDIIRILLVTSETAASLRTLIGGMIDDYCAKFEPRLMLVTRNADNVIQSWDYVAEEESELDDFRTFGE